MSNITILNGYAEPDSTSEEVQLAAIRESIHGQGADASTDLDDFLKTTVNAVSRQIDQYCARIFYPSTSTKFFTAEFNDFIELPDFHAVLTLLATDHDGDRVYEKTWTATDYDLAGGGQDWDADDRGEPWEELWITPNGSNAFPIGGRKGVKITTTWGYAATVPDMVIAACKLQVNRLFKRRSSPFGISGPADLGSVSVPPIKIPKLDPDVKTLLDPLRKQPTFVGGLV